MKSSDKAAFEAILIFTAILALAMLPIAARAESQGYHGPPSFADYDKNGDGFISEAEFQAMHEERMAALKEKGVNPRFFHRPAPNFSDFDANGDGKLTQEELAAGFEAIAQARRANAPGAGNRSSMAARMPSFSELDLNGDGCISAEEYAELADKAASQAFAKPK